MGLRHALSCVFRRVLGGMAEIPRNPAPIGVADDNIYLGQYAGYDPPTPPFYLPANVSIHSFLAVFTKEELWLSNFLRLIHLQELSHF